MTNPEPTTAAPPAPLLAQVVHLAKLRAHAQQLRDTLATAEAAFDAEHADEQKALADAEALVAAAEERVRQLAAKDYAATNDTAPAPGVSIKLFTRIEYSVERAIAWAKEHAPVLVKTEEKLDRKTFETMVKGNPDAVAIATITREPRVQLAADLAGALGVATPTAAAQGAA